MSPRVRVGNIIHWTSILSKLGKHRKIQKHLLQTKEGIFCFFTISNAGSIFLSIRASWLGLEGNTQLSFVRSAVKYGSRQRRINFYVPIIFPVFPILLSGATKVGKGAPLRNWILFFPLGFSWGRPP